MAVTVRVMTFIVFELIYITTYGYDLKDINKNLQAFSDYNKGWLLDNDAVFREVLGNSNSLDDKDFGHINNDTPGIDSQLGGETETLAADIWVDTNVGNHRKKHTKEHRKQKNRKKLIRILEESIERHRIKGKIGKERNDDDHGAFIIKEGINESHISTGTLKDHALDWTNVVLDHRIWLGMAVGSTISMATLLSGFAVFYFIRKRTRRNYCVDLSNLSLCSLGDQKNKEPVYVRLAHLHNPRSQKQGSQYIVSVMDQSNNFSICSDETSSEEEIFDISDVKRMQSPKKSISKISMTSTPVKITPAERLEQPGTPMGTRNVYFTESPLASPIVTPAEEHED